MSERRLVDRRTPPCGVVLPPVPPLQHIGAHITNFLLAVALLASGLAFFADPGFVRSTTIGHDFRPWDLAWNGFYVLGSVGILVGIPADHRVWRGVAGVQLELAGLIVVASAAAIEVGAILHHVGFSRGALIFSAVAVSYLFRAASIMRSRRTYVPVAVATRRRG